MPLLTREVAERLRGKTQEEAVDTTTDATVHVCSPLSEEEPEKQMLCGDVCPELRTCVLQSGWRDAFDD